MRFSAHALLLLLCFEFLAPLDATSQDRRLLVISSRVGSEIDSVERNTYRLFRSINDFQSASFYQAPDSTFWVWTMMKSPDGNLRDSAFEISYQVLEQCAEWVDHQEELRKGTYALGSSPVEILYADGGRLVPPSHGSTKIDAIPRHAFDDFLPLARNTVGLSRPKFQTIHLDLTIGLSFPNFSALRSLTGDGSNTIVPVSINIDIPFHGDHGLSLVAGWGFALGGASGGSLYAFSIFLSYRPGAIAFIDPFIGFGAGHADYNYNGGAEGAVEISASKSYPLLLFGLNIAPHSLDVLFTLPLATELRTSFESGLYTINPAGFGISVLVSL